MSKVVSLTHRREGSEEQHPSLHGDHEAEDSETAALNTLFSSLLSGENCKRFRAFPEGYCRQYGLSLEQIHAVTDLDVMRLLKLGSTAEHLARLTSLYGLELQELCIEQSGKSVEEIQKHLANK